MTYKSITVRREEQQFLENFFHSSGNLETDF